MSEPSVGVEYAEYLLSDEKYVEKGEFEVPARVFDLLRSFVESSTKPEYVWNNPPYRKVRRDGSYWQIERRKVVVMRGEKREEREAVVLIAVSWRSWAEAVLVGDDMLILNVYVGNRRTSFWTDVWKTEVVLRSRRRDGVIEVFDICRKLLFYRWLTDDC